ncbi:U3 small nucleolar RNA-associated protein [Plectosphaerella plurivora]|uniref:U3 small nucleolar RNA-associated protein 10 n=1 Tax=Plectosphaerella plurivora TaxID=936078 RepID=A0A9P8V434_9PEZI|nr:U3 small nucleolar RNA-associated protein [Plectosphaerella plurivora]
MASSLAAQLAQIAVQSKSSLNVKAQKAAHSKSLIFEPKIAANQSFQALYTICNEGFEELCLLDARFRPFATTLFSEQSQEEDRTQMTAAENAELDNKINAFLRLAGSRLRIMPAIKAIEWLVRRFRIHEENTSVLLTTFLPYHTIPVFVTVLSILPATLPAEYRFLMPYIKSLTAPSRAVLVRQAIHQAAFLDTLTEYTLEACRNQQHYSALISFWGSTMTEALNGLLENARSGRASIQRDNDQALLQRFGHIFGEAMLLKKVSSLQVAAYMAVSMFAAKGNLDDAVLSAFMEQVVHGWTAETVRPGLVCLSILAQYRGAKQMGSKVTKALLKVSDVGGVIVDIGRRQRVDKLANGLCIALVDRLIKKGDARGLSVIRSVLVGQVLREQQIKVIFKTLLVAAHQLGDEVDPNGQVRKELGTALIDLSRHTGNSSEIIQKAIEEEELDIEEMEMKLDVKIRQQITATAPVDDEMDVDRKVPAQDVRVLMQQQSDDAITLPSSLSAEADEASVALSQLFLRVVAQSIEEPQLLTEFAAIPALHRSTAVGDATFAAFMVRIWSGPYPTFARAGALDAVKQRLLEDDADGKDLQAIIPYCMVALLDSSRKVRRVAADLLTRLGELYPPQSKGKKQDAWGAGGFYADGVKTQSMGPEVVAKLLHDIIVPALEECVMDEAHLIVVLQAGVDSSAKTKATSISQAARQSILTSLASHVVATPLLRVKSTLLTLLNRIKGVSSTTRTKVLLPAFRWWADLTEEQTAEACAKEQLDPIQLDLRFTETIVPNDPEGLAFLLSIVGETSESRRQKLVRASFQRLQVMWPTMKQDTQFDVAETMLQIYQRPPPAQDREDTIAAEAGVLLKNVELSTATLAQFLDAVQSRSKMVTGSPPSKRRRTSTEANTAVQSYSAADLSRILRDVTFILQLVEGSKPQSHPELLPNLFDTLGELQRLTAVVDSELGYLQNLVLTSLIAMVPEYRTNKNLKINRSGGHGDLLANCIQKTSSPIVQNSALLLIASLATAAPDVVLHSIMPIFTFMGASVLRQNDDYSAHVVNQTIKEVVPPLMESLRKGNRNPIAGATELLVSFVTAYEHMPSHRKHDLFVTLVDTLGPEEFLFALLAMLIDKYGATPEVESFAADLLAHYSAEVQLQTLVKLLNLITDIFSSKPSMSTTLLGVGDVLRPKNAQKTALKQLTIFPGLLSGKKLKREINVLSERDDMETSKMRELYASLLQGTLSLAETVKADKELHECCGSSLANLLHLLSIGEFIKSVESLQDQTEMAIRRKVLRALEVRVEKESTSDAASRTALLGFLPQLTAAIRDTDDIKYKHTAVACIDKIAEKYGKKDPEAVAAAASTIAGAHCLGTPDAGLRVMALLCLTSLVDVLQDGILPVLSLAVPQAILYIKQSLEGGDALDELHNASYAFVSALAQHLPYMITGSYLDQVLAASNESAMGDMGDDADDSRLNCLRFLARKVDPKVFFTALECNWAFASQTGGQAVSEYIDILGVAIDSQPKSVVGKNVTTLSNILVKVLDLRRERHVEGDGLSDAESDQIGKIEASLNEVALKMIYKLNDAAFRPVFTNIVEWSTKLPKSDANGRLQRRYSLYGFLEVFFGTLKSLITSYATYVVDDAVAVISGTDVRVAEQRRLWNRVLQTLARSFEHDQDDFWQTPAHFGAVAPVLAAQFEHAPATDVTLALVPAVVELARAADSQDHQKALNTAVLKHLRSEQAAVRLAAVRCQQELTDKLGEEWLSALPEMLPYISELQDDDDEVVERETHRWIVKIEAVLGESLDSMLQ